MVGSGTHLNFSSLIYFVITRFVEQDDEHFFVARSLLSRRGVTNDTHLAFFQIDIQVSKIGAPPMMTKKHSSSGTTRFAGSEFLKGFFCQTLCWQKSVIDS